MKRRDALKTLGAMAGAAGAARVLPACGEDGAEYPVGIHNIVVVMFENRSYDHLLGARKLAGLGGDGLVASMTNPDLDGAMVPVYPAVPSQLCVPDPPHGWDSSHLQWASAANQGFLTEYQRDHGGDRTLKHVMSYLQREQVPVSWALADAYTTCDRYFCSVMGPTWPNRMYWHSGSSNGLKVNQLPTGGFNWPSIHHRLDDKGVEWMYHYVDLPVLAIVDTLDKEGRVWDVSEFYNDARLGRLKPVTYIDPGFGLNDDHPPHHPSLGQQFLASIYTALATSPQWNNTLLVVTYDEHGGFFDHVPPPMVANDAFAGMGFDQLGFRVPCMIAGPYVKQGYVSSTVLEHSSVLRHIEAMFDLEPCNARTAAANDLTDALDLAALAAGTPRPPVSIPAVEIDESMIGTECRTQIRAPHDVLKMADLNPALFSRWDRRHRGLDDLYLIGDYLERHNAGRIRRGR